MEQYSSLKVLIEAFANHANDEPWYKAYKDIHEQVTTRTDDPATIERLWYTRDNGISRLMQGAPGKDEYEKASSDLKALTQKIVSEPNSPTYDFARNELLRLKDEGQLSKFYRALLNRVFAAVVPDKLSSTVDEGAFFQVAKYLNERFSLGIETKGSWFEVNEALKASIRKEVGNDVEEYWVNIAIWNIYAQLEADKLASPKPQTSVNGIIEGTPSVKARSSLNQIFYGPPGTGKTYITTAEAVKAAEPDFVYEDRAELKAKYDKLVAEKRIRFVTFHQSYGYEEFIEGLRAVTEDGQVRYEVKPGVFKRICSEATASIQNQSGVAQTSFDACWNMLLNNFDDENGLVIDTRRSSFRITDISETTIHFEKSQGESKHTLSISTLKDIFNNTRVIKGGLNVYYQPLIEYLKSLVVNTNSTEVANNYVLVIDEINRGNISKIFGELITLIEDSKRAYGSGGESAEVVLPYSGDTFSVPSNLYLIGTMNTADRSLAMMDTALRRRFDFIEMMPDASLLDGCVIKGISLVRLLDTLNKRIELLYDREHTLGHAFLIPVKNTYLEHGEDDAFIQLKQVVLNKFIPLLEEYFFDDWNKIRLVLGDNQKSEPEQFVREVSQSYDALFGLNHGMDSYESSKPTYTLADKAAAVWDNPASYIGIYSPEGNGA